MQALTNFDLTLKFPLATLSYSPRPLPLHSDHAKRYLVKLKGVPSFISEEHFAYVVKTSMKRKGFTAISVTKSSESLNKWNAHVSFYDPFNKL